METKNIITILILFYISTNFMSIVYQILTSLFYIALGIFGLRIINKPLANTIENFVKDFVSLEHNIPKLTSSFVLTILDLTGLTKLFNYENEKTIDSTEHIENPQ